MELSVQYFNSEEAAKILGVNVSTIKRWTDEGKLKCIKSAGGHRKFLMEHLASFLDLNKKKTEKVKLDLVNALATRESVDGLETVYEMLKNDPSDNFAAAAVRYVAAVEKERAVTLIDSMSTVKQAAVRSAAAIPRGRRSGVRREPSCHALRSPFPLTTSSGSTS